MIHIFILSAAESSCHWLSIEVIYINIEGELIQCGDWSLVPINIFIGVAILCLVVLFASVNIVDRQKTCMFK